MIKTSKSKLELELKQLEINGILNRENINLINSALMANGYDIEVYWIEHGYPYYARYVGVRNIADGVNLNKKLQSYETPKSFKWNRIPIKISRTLKINEESCIIALRKAAKTVAFALALFVSVFFSSLEVKADNGQAAEPTPIERINNNSNSIYDVTFVKSTNNGSSSGGSIGLPGSDAFSPSFPGHPDKPATGFFGTPNPGGNGDGSGDGPSANGPDQPGCQASQKPNLPYGSQPWEWNSPSDTEASDSESDSDSDVQEAFELRKLTVIAVDGNKIDLKTDQFRDKFYHARAFEKFAPIPLPEGFDMDAVDKLSYEERLAFLRNPENLPDEYIHRLMYETGKILRASSTKPHPAVLGKNQIPGKVYVNQRTRMVVFVNKDGDVRTFICASQRQLDRLEARNWHLFPNV